MHTQGVRLQLKDVMNTNFNVSSTWLQDKSFWNEELREIEHVLEATRRTRRILNAHYVKLDLSKVASEDKHLEEE